MKIRVFQIRADRDTRRLLYAGSEEFAAEGIDLVALPRDLYEQVYEGDLPCADLDGVYARLQLREHFIPDGYQGHSLSISDVVEILERGDNLLCEAEGLWFVDNVGFKGCDWDRPELRADACVPCGYIRPYGCEAAGDS